MSAEKFFKQGSRRHRIWWHYSDGWPYQLPEYKKSWMPGWFNDWLGERCGYPMALWRPICWLYGHEPVTEMDGKTVVCPYCDKVLKK